MKRLFLTTAGALCAALALTAAATAAPILQKNDFIIAIDTDPFVVLSDYPATESPIEAVDGDPNTKYLNFGEINTGLMVTPLSGPSIVQSMVLTTAGDAPARDPASWAIYGTNENIDLLATGVDNGSSLIANWQLIAQGAVALPDARNTVGPVLSFANSTSYDHYRILFPTVKNAAGANSMQIAEIGLFTSSDGSGTSIMSSFDPLAAFQLPTFDSRYPANQGPTLVLDGTGPNLSIPSQSNSPVNEGPANAVNGTNAKYLNFGEVDSGFIVTPASGPSQVRSFQLTTANDFEVRDPTMWELYGANSPIVSANNSYGLGEPWTLIDSGDVMLPAARNTLGPVVTVDNTMTYASYKMIFTGTKDPLGAGADSMQIAEASFFASADGSGPDILNPGDPILGIDATILNGLQTKYLNFGETNSGLIVTPAAGAKVVTGLQITTANDVPARDPATFELYGTNDPITSADNSQGGGESWQLIASGDLNLPGERLTDGALITFPNSTSYTSYRLIFPTVKDAEAANSMQISGLQLFDDSAAANPDFDGDGDVDGRDFLIWQRGLGLTGQTTNANGDADANGTVGVADLAAWRAALGGGAAAVAANVPEPAAAILALAAALAGRWRRRAE